MRKILWANFFHIYEPPRWPKSIILKVAKESYRPILKIVKAQPSLKITLNVAGALTEQLARYKILDIINDIKTLAKAGKIELTGSAKYHTILPLIPEKEAIRQIKHNEKVNRKYFGNVYQPRGFFSPEMCYSEKLGKIVKQLGYQWIILDEIGYKGKLGKVKFDKKYFLKNNLAVIFRNRFISDFISFEAPTNNPDKLFNKISEEGRSRPYLVTAMDGENLGHHRHDVDKLWQKMVAHDGVKTLTLSEYLQELKKKKTVRPKESSWSTMENEIAKKNAFNLWQNPKNPIHQLQWQLLNLAIKVVEENNKNKHYQIARAYLDENLYSDPFWWASAHPWWDSQVIKKAALDLEKTISLVGSVIAIKKAEKLKNQIVKIVADWDKSGQAKKMSKKYLKEQKRILFMGGSKISATGR